MTRWRGIGRGGRLLVVLFAATVALKLVIWIGTLGGPLVGDEVYYLDAGRALSNAVRDLAWLRAPDVAELERVVVGHGWFMPGMSMLLAPLYLLVPGAPDEVARLWLGLVQSLLLAWAVLRVRRTFGQAPAVVLLVFPGLVPTWAAFGVAGWGDANAGLVLVVLLCATVESVRAVADARAPRWRDGLLIGLLALAAVYLRSSVGPLVVALLGVAFVTSLLLRRVGWRRVVAAYVVAGLAFLAGMVPWSVAASASFDHRVITTTSVPTGLANTFGDRDQVCFGECDPYYEIWFPPVFYAREQARAAGVSELDVLAEMSSYARREVSAESYSRDVLIDTLRYVRDPARYSVLLIPHDGIGVVLRAAAVVGTGLLAYPAVAVLVATLLARTRRSFDDRLQLALLKVGVLGLVTQPFLHVWGPRYWPTAAPLLALSAALLWRLWRERADAPAPAPAATTAAATRWLDLVQVGVGIVVVLVAVTVVWLAV